MGGGRGSALSPLLTGLVDYWPGDEASGPLLGGISGVDVTAVNSPGTVLGPDGITTAREGVSSEYFAVAAPGAGVIGAGGEFSLVYWYRYDAMASGYYGTMRCSTSGSPPSRGFQIFTRYNAAGDYVAIEGRGVSGVCYGNGASKITAGGWNFVAVKWETDRPYVRINGGAWVAASGAIGLLDPAVAGDSLAFLRNIAHTTPGGGQHAICGIGAWNVVHADARFDWLYNSGNGPRTLAEILAYAEA